MEAILVILLLQEQRVWVPLHNSISPKGKQADREIQSYNNGVIEVIYCRISRSLEPYKQQYRPIIDGSYTNETCNEKGTLTYSHGTHEPLDCDY